MGMSVGVVTIKYLDEPGKPVLDFLSHLMDDLFLGEGDTEYEERYDFDDELYTWGGRWDGNGLVEFSRHYLDWRVGKWADRVGIDAKGKATLNNWIADLPWNDDNIMFHLGV